MNGLGSNHSEAPAKRGIRRRAAVCAFVVAWGSCASVAHAEPTAAEIVVARRLFSEATALREEGRYADAEAKLREAIAIKETPGLRFHLALCEEKLGHLVEAQVEYDRADELIRGGAKAPDVAELVGPARSALKERVPTVVVRVPEGERDVRLTVDDKPVAPSLVGQAIPLDPGTHTLAVDAADRKHFALQVVLAEGDDQIVDVSLLPAGQASPTAPTETPATANEKVPGGDAAPARDAASSGGFGAREGVLLGEGAIVVAGIAVGTVFAIKHGQADDAVNSANAAVSSAAAGQQSVAPCAGPTSGKLGTACGSLSDAVNTRHTDSELMLGGFVGAGVGAVAAAVTWFAWPSRHSSENTASVQFTPTLGGVTVFGTF